jgi:hypothetical protein
MRVLRLVLAAVILPIFSAVGQFGGSVITATGGILEK